MGRKYIRRNEKYRGIIMDKLKQLLIFLTRSIIALLVLTIVGLSIGGLFVVIVGGTLAIISAIVWGIVGIIAICIPLAIITFGYIFFIEETSKK